MQIYASSHAIEQACQTLPDATLRKLFQERYEQLKSDDYEIHELVHFWVVESVEDLAALPPTPECKEEHPGWIEIVYVLLDDGFGTAGREQVTIVSKRYLLKRICLEKREPDLLVCKALGRVFGFHLVSTDFISLMIRVKYFGSCSMIN